MLTGIDHEGLERRRRFQRSDDRRHLDGFGPSADEHRDTSHKLADSCVLLAPQSLQHNHRTYGTLKDMDKTPNETAVGRPHILPRNVVTNPINRRPWKHPQARRLPCRLPRWRCSARGPRFMGSARIIKLYATAWPELRFVALSDGALVDWLREHKYRVDVVPGLADVLGRRPFTWDAIVKMPDVLSPGSPRRRPDRRTLAAARHPHRPLPLASATDHRRLHAAARLQVRLADQQQHEFASVVGRRPMAQPSARQMGRRPAAPRERFHRRQLDGLRRADANDSQRGNPRIFRPQTICRRRPFERSSPVGWFTRKDITSRSKPSFAPQAGADVQLDVYGDPLIDNPYADDFAPRLRGRLRRRASASSGFIPRCAICTNSIISGCSVA